MRQLFVQGSRDFYKNENFMTNSAPIIWGLHDHRPGNNSQVEGIASYLIHPAITKTIHYNFFSRMYNEFLPLNFLGIHRHDLSPPWPDIVISAGRRQARIAAAIKRKSGEKTFLCHMMRPELGYSHFDMVVLPVHDRAPKHPAIFRTLGAPHRITKQRLSEAFNQFSPYFALLPYPKTAVFLGGDSRHYRFTDDMIHQMIKDLCAMQDQEGGSLIILTSRRTPETLVSVWKKALKGRAHSFYSWGQQGQANPFVGALACCERMIVTQDSISMITEALGSGRPVAYYPVPPHRFRPSTHIPFAALFDALIEKKSLVPFAPNLSWETIPLENPAKGVAEEMMRRFYATRSPGFSNTKA
jgi:mitochondrial fission protein ELM1